LPSRFEKTVGGHEATPTLERIPECRLARRRLGARIERAVGDLLVLRPVWNEAPAGDGELVPAIALLSAHDRHLVGWRDVVVRFRLASRRHAERAIPNLIALALLSPVVFAITKEFFQTRGAGGVLGPSGAYSFARRSRTDSSRTMMES
jgi:hypothetical protein